jgi:toxin ParE1/3/4
MARILRTPQAVDDLFEIWEYIARRNAPAADALIRRLDDTFRTLASNPGIGQTQDRFRPGLRCFPVGRYLIFYLTIDDGIEVVRVLHGARDLPALFGVGDDDPT